MEKIIELGIQEGLVSLDDDGKMITYLHQNKKRNYSDPEEKVQTETFLRLIFTYKYPVERIKQFVSVQMGSETKQADIIVYNDDKCESPLIVVECKKEDITDQEFNLAVEQAYSYANNGNVHAKYVWVTSRLNSRYYEVVQEKPVYRVEIPDIPQYGVSKLAPYKYVKGGILQTDLLETKEPQVKYGQNFFELEAVSESELTKIFLQAHQALWGGGQRNPSVAFDELDKLIFCKIWDEKHQHRKNGEPYEFQIFRDETNDELFKRIKNLYEIGRKVEPEVFKDDITLTPTETQTIVKYFQRIDLNKTDLDSKGRAFETFMGNYFRGDFGQYFTPRPIVKFIVESLPIKHDSRVLDTSCGSGGFLLYALDKVRRQASDFYEKGTIEHHSYWHDFAQKNLFGIEINDQIARTAKMNMIIHDDGHTNVIAKDGLLNDKELKITNKEFEYGTFDFIITNPPFGSSIRLTEKAYFHQYNFGKKELDWLAVKTSKDETMRDSQSTEVLFIEQCYNFLQENGYLAIVIPDGILTNSSLQYVRDNIEEMFRIVAVVSMPQTAFTATGAGVKSSVLFLRKHRQKLSDKIVSQKNNLKDKIKTDNKYLDTIEKWEKEKKNLIKELEKTAKQQNTSFNKKQIAEIIKEDKLKLQEEFSAKINTLKEELTEKYFEAKKMALDDYPIFMAIAEDIGYDATGKPTNNNELDGIGQELAKFITYINKAEI